MENLEKRIIKIKKDYKKLASKTDFFIALAPQVGRTPKTLAKHWFSNARLSSDIPRDLETIVIIENVLSKSKKKRKTVQQ